MATLIPPAKKVKSTLSDANAIEIPSTSSARQMLIQLHSETHTALGPVMTVDASLARSQLEQLVNTIQGTGSDPLPYAFFVQPKSQSQSETAPIAIVQGLSDITELDTEAVYTVTCIPQAVFRVRAANRCSSTLAGHQAAILCASFSPTGKLLATGSGDCTVRIWDLDTETAKQTLTGHPGWVLVLEWSGHEKWLASGSMDGSLRLWSLNRASQIGGTLEEYAILKGHTKWITSISWQPVHLVTLVEGSLYPKLASSSKDSTVRVWCSRTKKCLFTLSGHTAAVNVVKWSGEGVIYTASSDRTVRVWSGDNGVPLQTFAQHAHWVTTLSLSTDFTLRTGPFDVKTERVASDTEAKTLALKRYGDAVKRQAECAITGSDDNTLFLWPPYTPGAKNVKPIARLTGHQKQISHVVFSPDGRMIASAGWDSAVRLWRAEDGKFLATLRGHVGAVYRLSWSCDSRLLISASKDSTLKIWDLKTHKIKVDLPGHTDEVYCVDFVANKVVSGGKDQVVKM